MTELAIHRLQNRYRLPEGLADPDDCVRSLDRVARGNLPRALDACLPSRLAAAGLAPDAVVFLRNLRVKLRLTGPDDPPPGIEDIGSVSDARSDGRWRRATVDLLEMLRPFFATEAVIKLSELQFAAHAVPEYAHAGIGANPAGATWHLDNVLLGAPVSGPVRAPRAASSRAERRPRRATR